MRPRRGRTASTRSALAELGGKVPFGKGGSYAMTRYALRRNGTPRTMSATVPKLSPGMDAGVWMMPTQFWEEASFGG